MKYIFIFISEKKKFRFRSWKLHKIVIIILLKIIIA